MLGQPVREPAGPFPVHRELPTLAPLLGQGPQVPFRYRLPPGGKSALSCSVGSSLWEGPWSLAAGHRQGPCWGRGHQCAVHCPARWHSLWPTAVRATAEGCLLFACRAIAFLHPSLPWGVAMGSAHKAPQEGATERGEGGGALRFPPSLLALLGDSPPSAGTQRCYFRFGGNSPPLLDRSSAVSCVAFLKLLLTYVCNLLSKLSPKGPHAGVPLLPAGTPTQLGGEFGARAERQAMGLGQVGTCYRQAVWPAPRGV